LLRTKERLPNSALLPSGPKVEESTNGIHTAINSDITGNGRPRVLFGSFVGLSWSTFDSFEVISEITGRFVRASQPTSEGRVASWRVDYILTAQLCLSPYPKPCVYRYPESLVDNMSSFAKTGRNIICIGRNYVAHVHELNNKVPKEPFYFLKPTSSYIEPGQGPIEVPQGINAHHEGMP
jgi:hypothetical protein